MKHLSGMTMGRCGMAGWKWLHVVFMLSFFHSFIFITSCSESEGDEEEFANWQVRNEAATAQWAANSAYRKIITYSKNAGVTGNAGDYIYVEVLETGTGTESPLFTDTCRVAYRGSLIPSSSYADGYVFDQSYKGEFNWQTISTKDGASWIDGFATALMNMHVGDRWRVRIPYELAYGSSSSTSYPSYSNMIFDVALIDFWHPGDSRPAFKARK